MPLLNYTTTIDPLKTAGEIEYILIKHGATAVMKSCAGGRVESLQFKIPTGSGELPIKLPINVGPVLEVLKQQKRECSKVQATEEQAERVAWRILKDWVEAQMAILETQMVQLDQIFLPYIMANAKQTLYEVMKERQFVLGPGGDI
jgi:hypothetical protein